MLFFPEFSWYVSWPFMAGVCAGYLTLIGVLALLVTVTKMKPLSLKIPVLFYNVLQVALCAYMTWDLGQGGFTTSNIFNTNGKYTAHIERAMLIHYFSKFFDFFDTIIMILKQNWRQVSFLHVYHHVSIVLVWGYLLQTGNGNGTAYFGAFINSFIHVLMYTHYTISILGIPNPLKKALTLIQMVQFGMCLIHAVVVVLKENVLPSNFAYLQLAYHVIMLILFGNYLLSQGKDTQRKGPSIKKKN